MKKTNCMSEVALLTVAFVMLYAAGTKASDGIYLKVGASYKTHSEAYTNFDGEGYQWKDHSSPIGARFELGAQKGNITAGVAHYSQWADGWPVNNDKESARTEIFVDVKFDLFGF